MPEKPILQHGVRILRPAEYEALRSATNPQQQKQLDALLLLGARYIEAQRIQENKEWVSGKFIHLPPGASLKVKMRYPERIIRLSNIGEVLIPQLFETKKLPSRVAWGQNLKRWAKKTNLDTIGLCAKATRKTYESWLVYYFPAYITHITLSQGHTAVTSVAHYLNMPFTTEDKGVMEKWVAGWI